MRALFSKCDSIDEIVGNFPFSDTLFDSLCKTFSLDDLCGYIAKELLKITVSDGLTGKFECLGERDAALEQKSHDTTEASKFHENNHIPQKRNFQYKSIHHISELFITLP